ncbi:winged helix-turn-helix domain-containing protein [Sphingomonas sp. KRR8]|uniref:winged helix-turn-helix domain-containing protein n=1 Tax=Sphingomonas sp. KRR8 TaxID=2942996 RepID=UPI0020200A7E|nr:winged helix-turn-helix domain-containing protein [Sphingomonas sp. KRR8]URD61107.1 winged helix-turn-helix domain-containing protein [Sphingomonas sp. KRR8]
MKVLVVEDDEVLREALETGLMLAGFTVDPVATIADARTAVLDWNYDAVVLDLTLPDGSGLDLLSDWRKSDLAVPVLLLTARNATRDRINGLDGGADDYLGKPFDLDELAARLRALSRRQQGRVSAMLEWRDLQLDPATRELMKAGSPVSLSRREFTILETLMEQQGRVLSRAQLEERLYGWQDEIESNAIEVHIHNLRGKLGRETIETVRGEGYRVPRR